MIAPGGRLARRAALGRRSVLLCLLLLVGAPLTSAGASGFSLLFHGDGTGDVDRVWIAIDGPARPADVGATDFTIEWWMKAAPGDNPTLATCGAPDGWITGHVILDRSVSGSGSSGEFGVSLGGGLIAFGVSLGAIGNTICGVTDVADGAWHHVAVTRRKADGRLRIWVDGVLDAEALDGLGANVDVSYPNGLAPGDPGDPFLVVGGGKGEAGAAAYHGWIDEIRLSTSLRYTSTFTRPSQPFATDANTAALYHLDEGAGLAAGDVSGAVGGPSDGVLSVGGTPEGPEWSTDAAPLDGPPAVVLDLFASGLQSPVSISHAGDGSGRLFIVQQGGQIVIHDGAGILPTPFLDVSGTGLISTGGERGLLNVAFHPHYADAPPVAGQGLLYVYFTDSGGNPTIARYSVSGDPDVAADPNPGFADVLLTIPHPGQSNHNGGSLLFSPVDGYLYAGVGDGGSGGDPPNNAQNLGKLLGKILRIDVDGGTPYAVPSTNPYLTVPSLAGARPEIWALGVRNPWRITFDRATGDLFIADVGQGAHEEVDVQPSGVAGRNYCWRRMEGFSTFDAGTLCVGGTPTLPILDYDHGDHRCAITGGYRYRGSVLPALYGVYVYGDLCAGTIWGATQAGDGSWSTAVLVPSVGFKISTFGEDEAGELYVADIGGGAIYKFAPGASLSVVRTGTGSGTVTSPGLINCGGTCAATFAASTVVALTATPGANSIFTGWSGACSGTGPCSVTGAGGHPVAAAFAAVSTFRFSASTYTASESSATATITVTRSGSVAGGVQVSWSITGGTAVRGTVAGPGVDYTGPVAGLLTFPANQTSRTFTIPLVGNTIVDGSRTILLALSSPSSGSSLGTPGTAILTITDDDVGGSLQFSAPSYNVAENVAGGLATITVTRSGGAASGVTVHYATVPGGSAPPGDYGAAGGTLTFGAGVMSQTFAVTINQNLVADGNRTVMLALDAPGGGATLGGQKTATLTILDDEVGLQFSAPTYTVAEGGTATITVARTGPATPAVGVTWELRSGTGTVGGATSDVSGPSTGVLAFAAGQTTRTFTVPTINDRLVEGPETILLVLRDPTGGALLGARPTAVLTITDVNAGGLLQFSQSAYTVSESAASATLTVTRANGGASNVTVAWAVTGGTASQGVDFTGPTSGVLAFGAGVGSLPVTIPLGRQADTLADGPRTIQVTLSSPQPAGLATLGARTTALLTLTDDDVAGSVQFSAGTYTVSEAGGSVTITVTRSGGAASGVTVHYATVIGGSAPPADYDAADGTLTFGAGVMSQTFPVVVHDNGSADGARTVKLALDTPGGGATLGGQKTATLNILDDEVGFRFSQATYPAGEGSGGATITVLRTGPATLPASVTVATDGTGSATPSATCTPGADYRPVGPVVLAFAAGQTSRVVTVPLCPDQVVDGAKTVGLALSGPSGALLGTPATAVVQIADQNLGGVFRFSQAATSVNEGAGSVTLTVTRSGGGAGGVSVDYVIAGGTATAPPAADADFTGPLGGPLTGTLAFAFGQTTRTLTIPIVNDTTIEPDETFTVTLQNAQGGASVGSPAVATVTIVDNDRLGIVQFSAAQYAVNEFAGLATITVTRTGSTAAGASVDYTVSDGSAHAPTDYTGLGTHTLVFSPGQGSQTFTIPIVDNGDVNGDRTVLLALSAPTGGLALGTPQTRTATLTIVDDEATVQFSGAAYTVSESGGAATITVTRTGGTAQAVTVGYATGPPAAGVPATASTSPSSCTAGADYRPVSGTLTFGVGQTTRTFAVPICGDTLVEGPETIGLTLGALTGPAQLGTPATATLTILDDDAGGTLRFSSATYGVTEGTASVTITVLRAGGSAGGVTVHYFTTAFPTGGTALPSTDYTDVDGTLSFGPGQTSATFTVPILNDALTDGPRTVTLTLDTPQGGASLGAPAVATLTIADNEPALRFSSATYSAPEGSPTATITVLRGGSTGGTVSVQYQTAAGTAVPGTDYADVTNTLTFTAGQTVRTFSVPLLNDTTVDGPRTVALTLLSPSGASLATPSAATLTLGDDDLGGTIQFGAAAYSVRADGGAATITVLRSGGLASGVTVQYATSPGTATPDVDYTTVGNTLTFAAGQTSQTFTVPILDAGAVGGARTVTLTLTDAHGGGALGPFSIATLWILGTN